MRSETLSLEESSWERRLIVSWCIWRVYGERGRRRQVGRWREVSR